MKAKDSNFSKIGCPVFAKIILVIETLNIIILCLKLEEFGLEGSNKTVYLVNYSYYINGGV